MASCRRNFMVPLPEFASQEAFNLWLQEQYCKRQHDVLRGERETMSEGLQRDLAVMRPFPLAPFGACGQDTGRVSSRCLVRHKTNDYRVLVAYGHQDVWIGAYVHNGVIGCRGEAMGHHPRCWDRDEFIFDPIHYLPLLEQKINALDQAAPLHGWELPEEFATLRRLMEARMNRHGRREYAQVLRLLETSDLVDLHATVKQHSDMRGRLRGREAPAALPRGTPCTPAGLGLLSLPAQDNGREDQPGLLHAAVVGQCGGRGMSNVPQILLAYHLKPLKLPTLLREHQKLARQCAAEGMEHVRSLARRLSWS